MLVTMTIQTLSKQRSFSLHPLITNAMIFFHSLPPISSFLPSLPHCDSLTLFLSLFVSLAPHFPPSINAFVYLLISVSSTLSVCVSSISFSVSIFLHLWPIPSANSELLTLVGQETTESRVWGKQLC